MLVTETAEKKYGENSICCGCKRGWGWGWKESDGDTKKVTGGRMSVGMTRWEKK